MATLFLRQVQIKATGEIVTIVNARDDGNGYRVVGQDNQIRTVFNDEIELFWQPLDEVIGKAAAVRAREFQANA